MQFDEASRLPLVHLLDELVFLLRLHLPAKPASTQVMLHALLAASDLQELVVVVLVPVDVEAHLFEGLVEGDAVPIAFGVDDDPVLVEEERFDRGHWTPPGQALPAQPRMSIQCPTVARIASLTAASILPGSYSSRLADT